MKNFKLKIYSFIHLSSIHSFLFHFFFLNKDWTRITGNGNELNKKHELTKNLSNLIKLKISKKSRGKLEDNFFLNLYYFTWILKTKKIMTCNVYLWDEFLIS